MCKRLVIVSVLLLLASCSSPHALPEAPTAIPQLIPATLPAAEEAVVDPAVEDGATGEEMGVSDAGAAIFVAKCAICHNLTAEAKIGPGLAGLFERDVLPGGVAFGETALQEWILTGGGAMPGVQLGEDELQELVAYLRQATQ